MAEKIRVHHDLKVYQVAFEAAMVIFETTKGFPTEERYGLTDQMRRSSRSVCANLAEAWRKRRYRAAFISKLSDAEGEAAETQVWLEFAVRCNYMPRDMAATLFKQYDEILAMLVSMMNNPEKWTISK
jgi:four helix bundle protein